MLPKFLEKMYRKTLFSRHDDDGTSFYFQISNFPGLKREEYSIKNQNGDLLKGYFYYYDGCKDDSLVIFDHGMGVGHRAYMREIDTLCKRGHLVYSYDHTGCTESEGTHIRGFSGSLADLDAVLSSLKNIPEIKRKRISVVGHSWGGFSTMNIGMFHRDLHAQVAISGFSSVKEMQKQVIPFFLRPFAGGLYEIEKEENPDYADVNAIDSLKATRAKVLIIHSIDDKTVSAKRHFYILQAALSGRDNIKFLIVNGKDHNPNYTRDAVAYKNGYMNDLNRRRKNNIISTEAQKKGFNAQYDFLRMTEQDLEIWDKIFETIE